jgi:hypothetical protein
VPERRVKRWGFSCWELLKDPIGHDHFKSFLEKEYATENLVATSSNVFYSSPTARRNKGNVGLAISLSDVISIPRR